MDSCKASIHYLQRCIIACMAIRVVNFDQIAVRAPDFSLGSSIFQAKNCSRSVAITANTITSPDFRFFSQVSLFTSSHKICCSPLHQFAETFSDDEDVYGLVRSLRFPPKQICTSSIGHQ